MNTREVLFKKDSTREQERVARAYREAVPLAIHAAMSLPDGASDEDRDKAYVRTLNRLVWGEVRKGMRSCKGRPSPVEKVAAQRAKAQAMNAALEAKEAGDEQ